MKDMNEEERIAELGKPRLGEISKVSIHIRESMEFKVRDGRKSVNIVVADMEFTQFSLRRG